MIYLPYNSQKRKVSLCRSNPSNCCPLVCRAKDNNFPLLCRAVWASLSCHQLAVWRNIFPVMEGTRHRSWWLSSGAVTYSVLALIWRWGKRDLTALPQKSGPSEAWKRDPPPPRAPFFARRCTRKCTYKVKKSSRSECAHAARACQCKSTWCGCTEGLEGGEWQWVVSMWAGGGARQTKRHSLNDGTWA